MNNYRTKTDWVFETLKAAIISGQLPPGEWIRNGDWAERLGVSPIPVREALRLLEAQGLVEIGAHKGARVTAQTEAHITETYLMRMALESLAARLAMQRISDAQFSRLLRKVEDLTEDLEKCVAAGDSAGSRQVNFEIHMAIYAASEMPRLLAMIESLWATYPFGSLTSPPEERKRMVQRHREYLDVLRERDPEKMALATEDHIRGAREGRIRDDAITHA
ncbi:MAG TPA: GntR family transcriptional regulator [Dehalococcoidia bacterium]|nr:GntR family transcriptional regulator [Dehalococcoidia bacterium]